MPSAQFPVHPEQSVRLGSLNGIRVREDTLFTNHKGEEKSGVRKREERTFGKLHEVLSKALGPDEIVLYAARCQEPKGAIEQLGLGWNTNISATVLVLTNQRLLSILVKDAGVFGGGLKWKRSLRSVKWGDIEEAKVKGWLSPSLQLKYRSGEKAIYSGLRRGDAKKIKTIIAAIQSVGAGEMSLAQAMVSLCPDCITELTPQVYECGKCHLLFKNEKSLLWRLLVPGAAYFYVGHGYLGVMHFIGEAYLILELVILALAALGIADLLSQPGRPPTEPTVAVTAFVFVGIIFALEKLITLQHCRRMIRLYIPVK
jgi:hypothetical protein